MMTLIRFTGYFTFGLLVIFFECAMSATAQDKIGQTVTPPALNLAAPTGEIITRFHWLGTKRLMSETDSAQFAKIWKMPETVRLESQALDKLSTAPWRLLQRSTNAMSRVAASGGLSQTPSALLRPLLDDLVQEESFLEISQMTNQPGELVLAIRLNADRAALWRTNLAAVLESLTGIRPEYSPETSDLKSPEDLLLRKHHIPDLIQLSRAGDWTLLAFGNSRTSSRSPTDGKAAAEQAAALNALLEAALRRIERGQVPFATSPTNHWFDIEIDLVRVANAFARKWNLQANFPKMRWSGWGEGQNIRIEGELDFDMPLNLEVKPWSVPTNLIGSPLTGFTAIRGFAPWLARFPAWERISRDKPPDQLFSWAEEGFPMATYLAAPSSHASNIVESISDLILKSSRNFSASNDLFGFDRAMNGNGLRWTGLPYVTPYIRFEVSSKQPFIAAGLFDHSEALTNSRLPEMAREIFGRTNLVFYEWEMTGARLEAWLFIGQFWRAVTERPQLAGDSGGMRWLKAISSMVSTSSTEMKFTAPDELVFCRKSSTGLTAIELHLIVDWMESPQFPIGFYTLLSTNSSLPMLH